ncbi:ribonuclease P protein component 4 [Metallosphaera hakonensis]
MKLIEMAMELAKRGDMDLSREYVNLALQYASKARVKIPLRYKRTFCRKCHTPLIPGITERRRIRSKILIRVCLTCGWIRRYDTRNPTRLKGSKIGRSRHKDREDGINRRS